MSGTPPGMPAAGGTTVAGAPVAAVAAVSSTARVVITLNPGLVNFFLVFKFTQKALGSITAISIIFTFTRIFWWITPNEKRTWSAVWAPPGFVSFRWASMSISCDIVKTASNIFLGKPTGPHVEGAGNVLQIFVFGGFTIMTARFHCLATTWEAQGDMVGRPVHWKQLSYAVIACSALITARQIDQVVVFDQMVVPSSYTITQEWVFWFFDQLPLLAIYSIFIVLHPGDYFPRDYTRLRLNRKLLLAIKGSSDESRMRNGMVISSPPPTGPDRGKSDWVQVEEADMGLYGIAK
ncbi:hypothetical protein NA57DRAFT_52018 [Rhizodiscina lignyota]|uniref:Uncharacterized protein n=1 Tax=Rhizodiscina lignyota TaxID=1504668 RepID=A0A9P4IIZ7_9PEZI|nr:hypothetical protein NA57DRAFT_52018 [Rhizodiscina lignyota]